MKNPFKKKKKIEQRGITSHELEWLRLEAFSELKNTEYIKDDLITREQWSRFKQENPNIYTKDQNEIVQKIVEFQKKIYYEEKKKKSFMQDYIR